MAGRMKERSAESRFLDYIYVIQNADVSGIYAVHRQKIGGKRCCYRQF